MEKSKEFFRVYALLIRAAQQRGFVTDLDVAELMGVAPGMKHRERSTAKLLELISARERRIGRPLLSAVVVTEAGHRPVRAVHRSATVLGLLPARAPKEQRDSFWQAELKRLYDEWAD